MLGPARTGLQRCRTGRSQSLFEQLEYFLNGEFDIDHATKHISFCFSKEAIEGAGTVELTNVVDEFSSTVEDAGSCKYREYVNLKFSECSHRKWKYYSCKWFVDMMKTQDVILSWSLGTYNNGIFYKEVNGAQRLYIEMRGAVTMCRRSIAVGTLNICIIVGLKIRTLSYVITGRISWTLRSLPTWKGTPAI